MHWWILPFLWINLAFGLFNETIAQDYNPITDTKGYLLYFFHINENISLPDSVKGFYGDTLSLSWHQPKTEDSIGLPKPQFYTHDDTVLKWIENDSSLYKYHWTGNDSSIWLKESVELYDGCWELSIKCSDLADNFSQFSDPFQFEIVSYPPGQPYELNIIIKRKKK